MISLMVKQNLFLLPKSKTSKNALFALLALAATISLLLLLPWRGDAAVSVGGVWNKTLDGQSYSAPATANGLLYVGSNKGILQVFNGRTGKLTWKFETDSRVPCLPFVARDGMVYLSSDNGAIYVLSAFTGELSWKDTSDTISQYAASPKLPYYHVFAPALGQKQVFMSTPNGNLHAFDRSNGQKLWTFSTMSGFITSPSVYKNTVFVGSEDGKLMAIDAESGHENWTFQTKDAIHYPPAARDGKVYLGSTDKRLYVIDAKTGKLDWDYSAEERIESTPLLNKNLVFFCSSNGKLTALDIDGHNAEWRFDSGGSVATQPVIDKNALYLGSNDGKLYALRASEGQPLWAYDTGGLLVNPVAVSDKFIYVTANIKEHNSLNTNILAFEKGTYPGTEVIVYGHTESPFVTSLVDYFSTTAKKAWTIQNSRFDLSDTVPWPFGHQLNQAQQVLMDLTRSVRQQQTYKIVAESFKYFSPGFSACTLLFSFALTPVSLIVVLGFLLLGWSLFLIVLSAFGLAPMGLLQTTSNGSKQTEFSFVKTCIRGVGSIFRNYQLVLFSVLITTSGVFISLALFNHLSASPTVSSFYGAILLTWLLVLVAGGFCRAFNLTFIQREELGVTTLSATTKYALQAMPRMFTLSLIYLISGQVICSLLGLGESYSFYFFTALAIFSLVLILILPIFADSYIIYDKTPAIEALRKSSYLSVLNIKVVSLYVTFSALIMGACSLLVSKLISSTAGAIASVVIVAFAACYLTNVHSILFRALKQRTRQEDITSP